MQKRSKAPIKLNVGCGETRLKGFINIDIDKNHKPDIVYDLLSKDSLPHSGHCDEVWFVHTIEHLLKGQHSICFVKFNKALKIGGKLVISFPHFEKIITGWLKKPNEREWFESTIYGRHNSAHDFHVCAVTPEYVKSVASEHGFRQIYSKPETGQEFNQLMMFKKVRNIITIEELYKKELFNGSSRQSKRS